MNTLIILLLFLALAQAAASVAEVIVVNQVRNTMTRWCAQVQARHSGEVQP